MTSEDRKVYNRTYYQSHKDKIKVKTKQYSKNYGKNLNNWVLTKDEDSLILKRESKK